MAEEADYETLRAENHRLRHTLFLMVTDRKKMASKLTGVQNLGLQLQMRELENKTLREKVGQLELSLAITANRITQLSLQAGSSQHSGGQTATVTPRKVLEALAHENYTRLEQALGPVRVDLTVVSSTLDILVYKLEIFQQIFSQSGKYTEHDFLISFTSSDLFPLMARTYAALAACIELLCCQILFRLSTFESETTK